MEFKFTNDTISSFSNVLGTFPEQTNESKMPKITFDKTIDDIDLANLVSLLSLSDDRVVIDLRNVDLMRIFKSSEHKKLLVIKDPETLGEDDPDALFLYRLLKKRVYQLVYFLLKSNPALMKIKFYEKFKDLTSNDLDNTANSAFESLKIMKKSSEKNKQGMRRRSTFLPGKSV